MVNTHASWKIDVNGPPKDGIYDLFRGAGYGGDNNDDDGNVNNGNNNNDDDKEMDRFVPYVGDVQVSHTSSTSRRSHNNIAMSSRIAIIERIHLSYRKEVSFSPNELGVIIL